jgi:hypothetical protein
VPIVLKKTGSLNLPELSGPLQACNGIALPSSFTCHVLIEWWQFPQNGFHLFILLTEQQRVGFVVEEMSVS